MATKWTSGELKSIDLLPKVESIDGTIDEVVEVVTISFIGIIMLGEGGSKNEAIKLALHLKGC